MEPLDHGILSDQQQESWHPVRHPLLKANWDSSAFKGKLVLIDFWATWCQPCKELAPELDKIYAKHRGDGLEFLSVATMDKKGAFDKFIRESPFDRPVLFDTKKRNETWHVVGVPAVFLLKDGQVIAQWIGVVKAEAIENAITSKG